MILQKDSAFVIESEASFFAELALVDPLPPIKIACRHLQNSLVIEPVFDELTANDDARFVPVIDDWWQFVFGWFVHCIDRARRMAMEVSAFVILKLVFTSEHLFAKGLDSVFDAAVSAALNFPLKFQVKILKPLFVVQIATS